MGIPLLASKWSRSFRIGKTVSGYSHVRLRSVRTATAHDWLWQAVPAEIEACQVPGTEIAHTKTVGCIRSYRELHWSTDAVADLPHRIKRNLGRFSVSQHTASVRTGCSIP
jgi:hypothetical protein